MDNKVKNIDNMNEANNENCLKNRTTVAHYEIIKKIVLLIANIVIAGAAPNPNQKPIIIFEDRLAYQVDQLFINYPVVQSDIKCGKLQSSKKTLIEHLEQLPLSILREFYEILDYDRCIHNLN